MTIQEQFDRFARFLAENAKCVHSADWERHTNVYTIPRGVWEKEGERAMLSACVWDNFEYYDCCTEDQLPQQDDSYDCISGIQEDDCGNIKYDTTPYTLYGRTVDYDGLKGSSNDLTPARQIKHITIYTGKVVCGQKDRNAFWKKADERNAYSYYFVRNELADGTAEPIVLVITE